MIKAKSENETLTKDDVLFFCKNITHLSEIYVSDFFKLSKLDPREPISKEQFVEVFPLVKDIRFVKIIMLLVEGASTNFETEFPQFLNFEDKSGQEALLKKLEELLKV